MVDERILVYTLVIEQKCPLSQETATKSCIYIMTDFDRKNSCTHLSYGISLALPGSENIELNTGKKRFLHGVTSQDSRLSNVVGKRDLQGWGPYHWMVETSWFPG